MSAVEISEPAPKGLLDVAAILRDARPFEELQRAVYLTLRAAPCDPRKAVAR